MFSVSRATPVRVADILNLFQYVRRRLNRRLTNLVYAGRMVGILQVDRRFNVSGITQLLVLANLNFELAVLGGEFYAYSAVRRQSRSLEKPSPVHGLRPSPNEHRFDENYSIYLILRCLRTWHHFIRKPHRTGLAFTSRLFPK
jgi:hypothetical protein